MSLLSYENTRPWARAMKNAVVTRKMPPWFADAQYGHFTNDRSLAQADIDVMRAGRFGSAGGRRQGSPGSSEVALGWLGDPTGLHREWPGVCRPAKPKANVIEWTYVTVPSGITQDTWVTFDGDPPQRAFGNSPHLRLL